MYEKFFSLDELPFDGLPDNRFYFVGNCQHEALEILTSNLSRNGSICVLSGPSGSGKTTLVRMLIRSLPKRMRIIAIDDPRLDEHMLLATILRASGVVATSFESIAELTLKLRKLLEKSVESGIVTTVICDEAQGLSDNVIEQIRLISNIEGELGKMINFLLVGQDELIEHIQKPMHKMFWSRVKAFANLKPLKRDEVHSYINFRMQIAGCHDPVFSTRAINAIFKGTKGLPRIVNSVADRALCIAFESQKKHVSAHMVKKAIEVVRHDRSLFVLGFKTFIKESLITILLKIPLILFGAVIAASIFGACYYYLPNKIKSESIDAAVFNDRVVNEHFEYALDMMLPGRHKVTKELALFNSSISQSVFKSNAINTLIKIWGYERADGSKATCFDVDSKNLKCVTLQQELSFINYINRPVILTMKDDSLMTFYVILYKYGKEQSSIIMDDKLWNVKTSFIENHYDGELTFIGIKNIVLEGRGPDVIKPINYLRSLERFSNLNQDILVADIENNQDMKKHVANISKLLDPDIVYSLLDNSTKVGPNLEIQN